MSLYMAENLPVLQNTTFSNEIDAKHSLTGDVSLIQDDYGVVHNVAFDASRVEYDENYDNEQSYSGAFREHLEKVLELISPYVSDEGALEVGCGDGVFLELLRERDSNAIGVDPSYTGSATYIEKCHFSSPLAKGRDFILMRHVLEHIERPVEFLHSIKNSAEKGAKIYIEVPSLEWIVENGTWFDIFYEHVNYFRKVDFCTIFSEVLDSGSLFGGQYIYVVANLDSLISSPPPLVEPLSFPLAFNSSLECIVTAVKAQEAPAKTYIWGASSKGVTIANALLQQGVEVAAAVDINERKQGRYLPVSGMRVLSPSEFKACARRGDLILIMNSQYSQEIMAEAGSGFSYIEVDKV